MAARKSKEPKPSLVKHASMRLLQPATLSFCADFYAWRWGYLDLPNRRVRMTTAQVKLEIEQLSYRPTIKAWERAQLWERKAKPILKRLESAMAEGLRFEKEVFAALGDQGMGVVAASLIAKARATLHGFGVGQVLEAERGPSRRTWLYDLRISDRYRPKDNRELAILSLLAGWWPDNVQPSEDSPKTIKGVIGQEVHYLRSAAREPEPSAEAMALLEAGLKALRAKTGA